MLPHHPIYISLRCREQRSIADLAGAYASVCPCWTPAQCKCGTGHLHPEDEADWLPSHLPNKSKISLGWRIQGDISAPQIAASLMPSSLSVTGETSLYFSDKKWFSRQVSPSACWIWLCACPSLSSAGEMRLRQVSLMAVKLCRLLKGVQKGLPEISLLTDKRARGSNPQGKVDDF